VGAHDLLAAAERETASCAEMAMATWLANPAQPVLAWAVGAEVCPERKEDLDVGTSP
jgi:hypothetical protein